MRFTRLFALTLCLVALASAGFAKNLPIKTPAGLAVDAAGNLYVCNFARNNILVYNSAGVQQKAKIIKAGIDGPEGVQFDPYGNMWVSNFFASNGGATGSITEYINGSQNTSATITNGVNGPLSIAIDSLDNLWVNNNGSNVTVYNPASVWAPPSNLVETISPVGGFGNFDTITVGAGVFLYGTDSFTFAEPASATLLGSPLNSDTGFTFGAFALAPDSSGNIYISSLDSNNTVYLLHPDGSASVFVTLPFASSRGMAVDNKNKRLYISNTSGSQIYEYSTTTGALLKIIQN
jgi:sugar lactone lactonase YvrE